MDSPERNPRARKLYTSPEQKAAWKARRPYRVIRQASRFDNIMRKTRRWTGRR